jgi:hypothetical protein
VIYCGSGFGSYFGKVMVPAPVPVPVPVPDPDIFQQFFNNKKFVPNLAFPMLEAALFQESWPLIVDFFLFFY